MRQLGLRVVGERVGGKALDFFRYIGRLSILFGQTIMCVFTTPFNWYRFLSQAKRVGPGSCLIASLVALFVGMIIALQMAYMMVRLSAEIYIPNVIAVSLTRELGPVLTALIVAGRIGAGITAEIGTMAVTEQIDALKAFAVSPVRYLVAPRFLALVVMLPILTLFAIIVGIFGGFLICSFKLSINAHTYWSMVTDSLAVKDIATGLIKTVFFGMIIAIVGCFEGLNVRGGADGVGKATTLSVVRSFIFIIMFDCIFTFIFYFLFNS
ncbi:MAG: ABC transporter permease [Candidatus Omnitrophica bacterium]|nr:ABC transporter permease [Candidatus Omnitrophota bacterium]